MGVRDHKMLGDRDHVVAELFGTSADRRLLDGRSEEEYLAQTERVGPYLTLLRGISFEEENIRWAERTLTIIEHRLMTQA